jgi:hypothetical protein
MTRIVPEMLPALAVRRRATIAAAGFAMPTIFVVDICGADIVLELNPVSTA